jgi:hypothetical protein
MRKIFGSERDQVTGDWKRWHSDGLRTHYPSPNIIWVNKSRIMRLAGHVSRIGERKSIYRVYIRKPEGRRSLGRPRHRLEDDI